MYKHTMGPQGRETKVFLSKNESLGIESEESRCIFSIAMTEKEWTQKKKSDQMCRVRTVYRALGEDRKQLGKLNHETDERRGREWPGGLSVFKAIIRSLDFLDCDGFLNALKQENSIF